MRGTADAAPNARTVPSARFAARHKIWPYWTLRTARWLSLCCTGVVENHDARAISRLALGAWAIDNRGMQRFPSRRRLGLGLGLGLGRCASLLATIFLAAALSAQGRTFRVGVLYWHRSPNDLAAERGIRKAFELRGMACEFVVHHADGDERKARAWLDTCRDQGLDLLFTMGTRATFLAEGWVGSLPIVFAAVTNPVEAGFAPSFGERVRRSSTLVRMTGTSNWLPPETVLHVFRLAVPGMRRLGILRSSASGFVSAVELRGLRDSVAKSAGASEQELEVVEVVLDPRFGIRQAVDEVLAASVDALWIPIDFDIYQESAVIAEHLEGRRVPVLSSSLRATKDAAIVGIVVDYELLGQKAAAMAFDILEGRRAPEDMPVETMQGYQIVINLEAAKRYGYEVPLPMLAVADRFEGLQVQGLNKRVGEGR